MVAVEIIEYSETQQVTPQNELVPAVVPRFTIDGMSGSFTIEAIPQSDFSRDRVRSAVEEFVQELLAPDTDVTVQFPSGE